ncbi:hypothetical protein [Hymenobacter psoromatis]|uniref:hypothetical protein n=1 Tax=Hymenobacter psoromatis TaxID=1484116 RepID=UPI001CBB09CC|nr:hypothetical protein [Hymenobacter psoromatis]
MAELRIQPKKSAPSPWLLVALALLVLAAATYFFLRPDPADEPARPVPASATAPAPGLPPGASASADSLVRAVPLATDSAATAPPATAASPARAALLRLSPALTQLVDRPDLRDDATVREQRDNFTSATARLEDGDPRASLRPGLVAAANLLLAVQQKAYPNLDAEANGLVRQATQLSGRDTTPAEQAQNQEYLRNAASLLNTMSYPAADVL